MGTRVEVTWESREMRAHLGECETVSCNPPESFFGRRVKLMWVPYKAPSLADLIIDQSRSTDKAVARPRHFIKGLRFSLPSKTARSHASGGIVRLRLVAAASGMVEWLQSVALDPILALPARHPLSADRCHGCPNRSVVEGSPDILSPSACPAPAALTGQADSRIRNARDGTFTSL